MKGNIIGDLIGLSFGEPHCQAVVDHLTEEFGASSTKTKSGEWLISVSNDRGVVYTIAISPPSLIDGIQVLRMNDPASRPMHAHDAFSHKVFSSVGAMLIKLSESSSSAS